VYSYKSYDRAYDLVYKFSNSTIVVIDLSQGSQVLGESRSRPKCGELKNEILKMLRSRLPPKAIVYYLIPLMPGDRPLSIDMDAVQAIFTSEEDGELVLNIILKGAVVEIKVSDSEPCVSYDYIV
jgi:hypothetical protein